MCAFSDPTTRPLFYTVELSYISLTIIYSWFNEVAESAPAPQEE